MARQLPKAYEPKEVEDRLYAQWEGMGYFVADNTSEKEPFVVVIPPPNVTGELHMGHAINTTYQDITIRYKKLRGYETLWLPGTDHAGIATQARVEDMLRKEQGLSRYDLGREAFLDHVWAWKEKFGNRITNQLRKMGAACDWSRERFTFDEGCSIAVRKVFVDLYNKGLIYQGERVINWCPYCRTALSDIEVEHNERGGHLWYVRYPVAGCDEYIVCATTRPETMLGDTGIAVHPNDTRYTHLVGQKALHPLTGRELPIVADEVVDMEFGTGCVKVTPCHDPVDFEIGARHGLGLSLVIDEDGRMTKSCGKYGGFERYEAREAVVADLLAAELLERTESITHAVGCCYRCDTAVETVTSTQWFVKMKPLAEPAIAVVKSGDIRFVPERFAGIYYNWMENVRDWCISRQIWWGHRIPAFYCDACGLIAVSEQDISLCQRCGAAVRQDEDVLDTWFSSALWPFSTFGWPEQTVDLERFYPTSTLVTGYDIIFFWVARMIFSGLEQMGQKPFSDVLINGLVRDEHGRKMSKSAGNGIDPLDVISEYGADSLRFALISGTTPGGDTRLSTERVEAARNFANKVWNAARFVLMNLSVSDSLLPPDSALQMEDKWILSKLSRVVANVTDNMEKYDYGVAASNLYDFVWDDYCDWYIELVKTRLLDKQDTDSAQTAQRVLVYVLQAALCMLHPFMPFITEEIFLALPSCLSSIMLASWPTARCTYTDDEEDMEQIMAAVRAIRARRAEMNVPPSKKATLFVETERRSLFEKGIPFFRRLASVGDVSFDLAPDDVVTLITSEARLSIPLGDIIDIGAERARLVTERENLLEEIKRVEDKLSNPGFLQKAPVAVVEEERKKGVQYTEMLKRVEQSIAELGSK